MDTRTGLPVVGMVGGGELARMTHQAAISLGQSLRVFTAARDDPAALVATDVRLGNHTDLAALRAFAQGCDVVTFCGEHVPDEHIRALAAEGVTFYPSADALRYSRDNRAMRERLSELGVPVARSRPAEVQVSPGRELTALVARSPFGQVAAYPVMEMVRYDGRCAEALVPAPGLPPDRAVAAQQLAIGLATDLDVVGLLAVEFSEVGDSLPVSALAMRPHDCGHWSIDGARTSQFEQHLRAVLDYPLGDTGLVAPAVVMMNVSAGEPGGRGVDERLHHLFATDPAVRVHLYGRQARAGRRIGHVTVLDDDIDRARARARRAARWLQEDR